MALVRGGADWRLGEDPETGADQHTVEFVYREIVLQLCANFPGLPDVRTLTLDELDFFYNGLRKTLHEITKPR